MDKLDKRRVDKYNAILRALNEAHRERYGLPKVSILPNGEKLSVFAIGLPDSEYLSPGQISIKFPFLENPPKFEYDVAEIELALQYLKKEGYCKAKSIDEWFGDIRKMKEKFAIDEMGKNIIEEGGFKEDKWRKFIPNTRQIEVITFVILISGVFWGIGSFIYKNFYISNGPKTAPKKPQLEMNSIESISIDSHKLKTKLRIETTKIDSLKKKSYKIIIDTPN